MSHDGIKERAQDAQQQVKQTAQTRVREQVDTRSTQAGEQVSATAQALRTTSRSLHEEGQDAPAKAADQLAGYAERIGDYLTKTDGEQLLHDAEEFGRRQPLAAIGFGLVVGIAASRLLKASSRNRYESRQTPALPGDRVWVAP
ncbi:hypothetical protein [Conexibacter sp. CPCC 206217]|uniref:hypothetical protein n=1 Tax=Conexibacter sp. CPCC 206217 TaxID=3064574 RepID=UPI002726B80A|nr:hypothetical protein [Conexibacter sp. CPCC 206217]MDO8212177.1 hypothetical protein [Conexibacter sp. CPCC 206217]